MVYSGTILTEEDMALMSGENVDSTGDTEPNHNLLAAQAESYLSVLMRENVVDNFAGYDADFKAILTEWAARYAGITLIAFNMAGFTSRIEAEDMINIHIFRMKALEKVLIDQKAVTFIKS